jgi:exonuclease III
MQYKNQLRILHWNAQGVSTLSKQVQLEQLLERKCVDICLLNETFLKDHHKMSMTNFKIYRNDRERFGGGVAILIRNTIEHTLLPIQDTVKIENISIQLYIQQRPVIITSAYSPSYGNNFRNDILKLCPYNKEFLVFGDFNAKHSSWNCMTNNRAGIALFDLQNNEELFI